ncbi:type II toxin-antitoxin system RelE family toxin [Phyllobacterium endophyticum]|uniref:Type II toxin-antitoxin system mRNA interferase toxin, RelE/StbE family n=1 Tax=Phyllobacterium endophyticum TaxID=1149773 RepID=A0A2P7AV90_9HYPH|nr:type II toxin-antitoxin system RelE/ParE family toxin [Phyllobacterium endophyticum]PSH58139.1 type II toxin-antitoxin system mRNA interferase toxin, RelE/StbE family [Phyllobacterium endophyticum]TYR38812.1 type II toxin-antitoxin system RelE/ParE family toxin [Phyllobacterium endophyticum]
MAWTIEYTRSVQKSLKNLDTQTRGRIRKFLDQRIANLDDPRQTGKALQSSELGNYWRYRIGDYRILCDLQDHRLIVLVVEIGHRREVYR